MTYPARLLPTSPQPTPGTPYYNAEHAAFRQMLRRWVSTEIEPYVNDWDEALEFPRELYRKAASIGLLQLGFPEAYGGVEADIFHSIIAFQELARAGSGGVLTGLLSHTISAPPIVEGGSEELKARVLPGILSGERIAALAVTEPGGGSDVASIATTARRDGEHYVVNGTKTFITSGIRADCITLAVRTGGAGRDGISLLLVETEYSSVARTPLSKTGWWASDTATLYFDDTLVPVGNLLGSENGGFKLAMHNFNSERLSMAAACIAFSQVCLDETVAYARDRRTFGKPLLGHQAIRHKLVDMAMRINAAQAMLENLGWRIAQGEDPVAEICMLKNLATLTMEFCAREATQTFGGAGYLRGCKVERIAREVRVNAIGGGPEEIMRDLAARQMGW